MTEDTWRAVDALLAGALLPDDDALTSTLAASSAAGLPPINVSPLQGRFLHLLVRIAGARRVLEVGTLAGYSTIWMATALPASGTLVTLEADERHAEVARENLRRAGLESVRVVVGSALATLPTLVDDEPFDLVFIDADKTNNAAYVDWAVRLGHPGTVIVVDNVVRRGEILDQDSDDPRVSGTRTLFDRLSTDERLDATAIQTVGAKGYDGFVLAVVR